MPTEHLPPRLARAVAHMALGRLEQRLPYRAPRFAKSVCWSVVGLGVLCWAGLAFFGPGPARPAQALVASLIFLLPPLWYLWRFRVRSKGGVYVFPHGIAEAYGNRVKKVMRWQDVFQVVQETEVGLFRSQRKIDISAVVDNKSVSTITVYSMLSGFEELRQLVVDHVDPTILIHTGESRPD